MPNPAEDLATHIATSIAGLTIGTNVFASRPRAPRAGVPTDAVFCWAVAGKEPDRSMAQVDEIRWPVVLVHVRNARQKTGSDLAQNIFNQLRGTFPVGYQWLASTGSSPIDIGYDSDGRHQFVMGFEMAYLEVAAPVPPGTRVTSTGDTRVTSGADIRVTV